MTGEAKHVCVRALFSGGLKDTKVLVSEVLWLTTGVHMLTAFPKTARFLSVIPSESGSQRNDNMLGRLDCSSRSQQNPKTDNIPGRLDC